MAESGQGTKLSESPGSAETAIPGEDRLHPLPTSVAGRAPAPLETVRSATRRRNLPFFQGFLWRHALAEEQARGTLFVLFAVFLGSGAALYQVLSREPPTVPAIAALAVACLLAMRARRTGSSANSIPLLCAAFLAGFLAARFETLGGTVLLDGPVTTTVTGTVLEREIDEGGRVRYVVRVASTDEPELRRPPETVRLTASASHTPYSIGAAISGRARLSPPLGPAFPGGYDFARSAFAAGIGAYGFFYKAPEAVAGSDFRSAGLVGRIGSAVTSLRGFVSNRVRAVVSGDPGALIAALTVSDRRGISEATVETLRATGLAHILAISGLHMALAAGTFYLGLRKLTALFPALVERFPVKKAAAVAALAIATGYLAISGAGVATQRAWIMMSVMFVAVILDRPALTMRNVALAAIVIVLVSPSAVVSPGFQMSFAATVALIASYDAWSRYRSGSERARPPSRTFIPKLALTFLRGFSGLAMTSLVAGFATGLFAAWHFHRAAGLGLAANLIAMPLVSLVVMPSGLIAMLAMPFGLDRWPLIVMGKALEGVVAAARFVDGFGGDVMTGQIRAAAILLAGSGFLILTLLSSRVRLLGLVPIAAGLVLALPAFAPSPPSILVSEDGRLVGLVGGEAIATNAGRPSDFIFEQWRRAYRRDGHLSPITAVASGGDAAGSLSALAAQARRVPGRFICHSRSRCIALADGRLVAALGDPADFGAACDIADIVVLSVPIRTRRCYSGAYLVTARTLRETGALAIETSQADLRIVAALAGSIRPWTIQRWYDWRADSFTLPDAAAARAVSAKNDAERSVLLAGEADMTRPANAWSAGPTTAVRSLFSDSGE